MKFLKITSIALSILLAATSYLHAEVADPRTYLEASVKKSDIYEADDVKDFMTTIVTTESKKGRVMQDQTVRIKLIKQSDMDKVVARYLAPEDNEGLAYLTHRPKDSGDKEPPIWLYMPAMGKTKRISLKNSPNALPGFNMNVSTVDVGEADDFFYKELESQTFEGAEQVIIEVAPKEPKDDSDILNIWIDAKTQLVSKSYRYNLDGELVEESTYTNYEKHGTRSLPNNIRIENFDTQVKNTYSFSGTSLNNKLRDRDFNLNTLKKEF